MDWTPPTRNNNNGEPASRRMVVTTQRPDQARFNNTALLSQLDTLEGGFDNVSLGCYHSIFGCYYS
jgi:hypothetical protein